MLKILLKTLAQQQPEIKLENVKKALELVDRSSIDRKSYHKNRSYLDHVVSVVNILLPFKPDEATIIAAILHEAFPNAYHKIKEMFNHDIAELVMTIEGLRSLHLKSVQEQAENYKKLLLAMAKDLRVILIRLADRLDNMSYIQDLPKDMQKNLADETMQIYVPIAMHLGIYNLKTQLEDLAFAYINPKAYVSLENDLKEYRYANDLYLNHIHQQLVKILKNNNVKAEVSSRLKHKYSIYQKLLAKGKSTLDSIFDIFALRVVLGKLDHVTEQELIGKCYEVLGVIHRELVPIPHRFKDYIANPKPNGYMSLHTTVLGLGTDDFKKPVEIQIRTKTMHEESEYGIAAHSIYKEADNKYLEKMQWVKSIVTLQKELKNTQYLNKDLQYEIFQDRIFVLSEEGKIFDLPVGATALDFAYSLDEEAGHRCNQVKVNGIQVPFDHVLENGDVVNIAMQNRPNPKWYWIAFVKTTKAKTYIKNWFKNLTDENSKEIGKNIINKNLEKFGLIMDKDLSFLKKYGNRQLNLNERNEILSLLGRGELTVNQVLEKILPELEKDLRLVRSNNSFSNKKYVKERVLVTGEDNVPFEFCACCNVREGDPIVGYVGRGKSVKIHHRFCSELPNHNHDRLIEVSWANVPKQLYAFEVKFKTRPGIIADISNAVSKRGFIFIQFVYDGSDTIKFLIQAYSTEVIDFMNSVILAIDNIVSSNYRVVDSCTDLSKI
ncbi:MAG: (p)ppGpp synthetase I SpoT/RelA, GTP pyrophosphokinase [Candidatus Peregrinibacteria bacterium GW2011_GWF2_33_10]|nr:MAG: (p)ppGpp synthetase I SpoT/RelA, GTP pyrophosphokinase [Candidatus Peregrinibacteria bacterium GW2011_GWF2_33_10]OGJ45991.1 MAG: hypothetical protein A2263_02745 [Candidatus Peregrinibacteria bacterium RIFOXYA2_FULL_33_21]OGJ46318.1 MAG: hypothetical protein A2272_03495 [Candidatus Peregrinibacteria bacterium RIFOXYA12_FULL_33_12]OGJ51675.1 MAG: hypothetical protein A2307_04610 [Candidatus Peregrinibacteria bacterium RIFOXYB2_FULL_33_20]